MSASLRGPDGGPIYTETDLQRWIAEPFNTASNLLFLAIVLYWAWRLRKEPSVFVGRALVVLFVGFVGGTVYHATRSHAVWLLMDWVPILVLCLAASVRYVRKLNVSAPKMALGYLGPIAVVTGASFVLPESIQRPAMSALGYTTMACWVAVPLYLHLRRHPGLERAPLLRAVICFLFAIGFRTLDRVAPWPFETVGTHFLWHLLGALSTHFIIQFVHADDQSARSRA